MRTTESGDAAMRATEPDRPGKAGAPDRGAGEAGEAGATGATGATGETGEPGGGMDEVIAAVRPMRGLEREHLRARLGMMLFDEPVEPVRLGRFVILDKLGEGGMGVVYSAHDPELDRRVALKLWRARNAADAQDRLMREAQALARLSHPNVVPVHDVGVLDGQVFIVMEFVTGTSLRAWLHARARSFERILDVYTQAGRGLAAAHAVGLVHRDFKPDNALVGSDGRVRVVDFGLARGDRPGDEALADGDTPGREPAGGPAGANLLQRSLTRTGARLGTPAYMSPEQLAGARVGPASDQWSFCAALYEALYGRAAFAGDALAEREVEVCAGRVREPPPGSRVPRWVFPVLRRGLAVAPGERWPSMSALLAELGRDRARAWRRALLAAGMLALLAATGLATLRSQAQTEPVCDGGARAIAGVWNDPRRAAIERAFAATGRAYAGPAWQRVSALLDAYAGGWADTHRALCLAHRRGEQSTRLLERGMACLERRRDALGSAVAVLAETRSESLGQVVEVAGGLPSLTACSRSDALAAEVAPPEDASVAAAVEDLRRRLGRARALEQAGRYPDGLAEARAVVERAGPLGYAPLLAEALLVQGHVAMSMRAFDDAIAALDRAARLALAEGVTRVAVEAMARRVYAAGMRLGAQQGPDIGVYTDLGEALGARLPERPFLHALLFNNAGAAALARGARDTARAYFERAIAARQGAAEALPLELVHIDSGLAMVTADDAQRAARFTDALRTLETTLGAEHPTTVWMRAAAGMYRASPAQAHALVAPACLAYQRYHPEIVAEVARCRFDLAVLEIELGRPGRAVAELTTVADLLSGMDGDPTPRSLRALARGLERLHGGDPAGAQAPLREAVAEVAAVAAPGWGLERQAAQAWLGLGESALALGQPREAVAALEQALPVFERVAENNYNMLQQRGLARTRALLGMTLSPGRDGATRERVRTLVDQAEQWYRAAGEGYEQRVSELAAWRRAHGVAP
jgi:tetratricopeptide (TPR) repeat protein/predicted Ser/Thr protein kinase